MKKKPESQQPMNEPEKKKKKSRVLNTMPDIKNRTTGINPLSMVGISAMTFPDKISTVRSNMAARHTSQYVVLTNPEFPRVYTGAEDPFGMLSSWNVTCKHDYELVHKFVKFKNEPISPVVYVFRDKVTGKYKCEQVNVAENLIEKYGFRTYDRIVGNYDIGDTIPSGTPISQSSSYVGGHYCSGRNLRLAYTVLPELTEDALIISESAAKKLEYDMVDMVTVNLKKDSYLINNYGSLHLYKPFPNVGEYVQNDIICSIRENSYLSSTAEALIPHINDKPFYSHGQVVDIDVFSNVDTDNDQLNYYARQCSEFYQEIYSFISNIVTDPYQDDISLLDVYHTAEKYLAKAVWVTKEYIVDTQIRFKVLKHVPIHVGQKIVGRYGNKSVITAILPDECMPKTEDGRHIEMLANGLAIPNRIIAFATYEATMTFMMERMWEHILKLHEQGVERKDIISLVVDFVGTFEPRNGTKLMQLYQNNPDRTYQDIINNGIYIQIMPLNEVCVRDALITCYTKWPDIMKKHKLYTKLRHRWIELPGEYAIGYQYTWVLKQEPSKAMSAVATSKTTWYDQPVKSHLFGKKSMRHYSDNPIKFGEYDTYNFCAAVGIRNFSKITTYFRGSQYEENSILMSHLNDMAIDTTRYNQFPQLDNLKNVLKFMGIKMAPEIFSYNSAGRFDEIFPVMIANIQVDISIPDLRHVLILNSYYMQYQEQVRGLIDITQFFQMIDQTELFKGYPREYVEHVYRKFCELIPIINQIKEYE
jgi:hypothetical protein